MNKVLILLIVALVAVYATETNIDWRIIGISDAPEGAYPYQVSLRHLLKGHICGGAIINPNVVITAAHCVKGQIALMLAVVVGTNQLNDGGTKYQVVQIKAHKSFNPDTNKNDIALLKLVEPIQYSDNVGQISLPSALPIAGGEPAVLTGWGRTFYPDGPIPNNLQQLELITLTNAQCAKDHDAQPIYDSQICTFTKLGEGACQGDSGSPLVSNEKLIGIVSWEDPCSTGTAGVYTRVSSYLDWIEENA